MWTVKFCHECPRLSPVSAFSIVLVLEAFQVTFKNFRYRIGDGRIILQITRTFLSYASLPSGLQSLKWAAKNHQSNLFDQLPATVTRVSLISSQPVHLELDKFTLPSQLKVLCISNFLITDLHFNRFPRTLQAIQITNCDAITDTAVQMLTPSNFPHLRQVSITSANVSKDVLNRLPNYVIVYSHTHQNLWFSNIY